jgi:hypothetical protein
LLLSHLSYFIGKDDHVGTFQQHWNVKPYANEGKHNAILFSFLLLQLQHGGQATFQTGVIQISVLNWKLCMTINLQKFTSVEEIS